MSETIAVKAYEQYAADFMEQQMIPGAMVGISENGNRVYEKVFGYRQVAQQLPIDGDTVFGIASMTKSFTCVGIMKLQEAGKLSVSDPIVQYLPELLTNAHVENITIHHLMTHTAGYPPLATHVYARKNSIEQDPSAKDYGLDLLNNPGPHIETYDEMLAFMANEDVAWLGEPGEYYSYSNDSYGLLGVIISRVSGEPYESFMEANVLKPARLTRSFFEMEVLEQIENVTTLYMKAKDGTQVYEAPLWWDAPSMRAVGYLKSTVNDIIRYLELYWNEGVIEGTRILSKESVEQMMTPHIEYEPGKCYGYGLRIIPDYFGSKLISHGGGLKGVSSFMCAIPEKKLAGVILTNVADVSAGDVLMAAMNVVEGRPYDASTGTYEIMEVDSTAVEQLLGVYTSSEGMHVTVELQDGLFGIVSNGQFKQLWSIGDNHYVDNPDNGDVLQFIGNENGAIDRIVYGGRHILKNKS